MEYEPKQIHPDVPLYFVRSWGGPADQPGQLPDNVLDTRMYFKDAALMIYGYAIVSQYEEDGDYEQQAWNNRRNFLSYCFSEIEPSGEMGFTCADDVQEITEEEFAAARERGWLVS